MTPEAKAARNAYHKKWRRENPDKVKAISDRHWEKVAREMQQNETPPANDSDKQTATK